MENNPMIIYMPELQVTIIQSTHKYNQYCTKYLNTLWDRPFPVLKLFQNICKILKIDYLLANTKLSCSTLKLSHTLTR